MTLNRLKLIRQSKTTTVIPSEYSECIALVEYLHLLKRMKKIKAYTHIPNETYTTSWNAKRKNVAMGVESGFPDYVVVTNNKVLFIEMKKRKGGVVSDNQNFWLESLNSVGATTSVCRGYEEAKAFIDHHLINEV
jgi:hypothetical protein